MAQANLQFQLSADDNTARAFAAVKQRVEEINNATNKLSSSISNFGRIAVSAFAAIQVGQTAKSLADLADQYNLVNSRLKVVTDSTQEFTSAQKALFGIAQNTRIGYAETVNLFTQLTRQTKDLNVPQEKMLTLTEGINKALIVSGATGQSAQNALIQLGQGFAAGALRGAEFMSVQEQAPRILEAVRDGLGITQSALKKMADEGQLTTTVFMEGFLKGLPKIEREFSGIPVTISGAMQNIKTSVLNTVGELDKLTGASGEVAKKIQSLSESIVGFTKFVKENNDVISGVFAGTVATATLGYVAAKWAAISASATTLVAALSNPVGWAILGIGATVGGAMYLNKLSETLESKKKELELLRATQAGPFNRVKEANIELLNKEKKLLSEITQLEFERFGFPGQDYPDEIARLEKRNKQIFAAPLSKEQENLIKAREKMMQDINDRVLEAQKGERSLFELQAKRIGFGGESLKNLMMQYDVLQKIKADDEEIERITQEFEKVRKENEKTQKAQDELDEKNKNIVQTFREQMQLYQESIILRDDLTFKTALQIQQEEQLIAVRKKYEEVERKIRLSDDENKEAKLKALEAEKKRIEELIVANTKMKEFQQNDLIGGGIRGYQKYLESITNFADQSQQAVERAFQGMENALVSFVQTGTLKFGDLARSIIADITRIYIRQTMIAPIMNALMPSGSNVSSFALANANLSPDPIGTLINVAGLGGRAMGGPVTNGKSYIVGENGPELFTPQSNGTIIPNGVSAGITVNQVINVTTGVSQTVRAEIMSLMPQIAGAAKAAVADAKLRGGSYAMALR